MRLKYWKENIERHYRFVQVRGRYYTEREILMEMPKGGRIALNGSDPTESFERSKASDPSGNHQGLRTPNIQV